MKTRTSLLVWLAFALCAVLVLAVMAWLTRGVLEAEQHRAHAEAEREAAEIRADIEERTRLALWRMDATGAAVMLRENSRTIDESAPDASEILLRFTSERGGPMRFPALEGTSIERDEIEVRIARFRALLAAHPLPGGEWDLLHTAAIEGKANWAAVRNEPQPPAAQEPSSDRRRIAKDQQIKSNVIERSQRVRVLEQTLDAYNVPAPAQSAKPPEAGTLNQSPAMATTQLHAVWLGGELMLLREITRRPAAADRLQGVWIDWRALAGQLLKEIPDLLPGAQLVPADTASSAADPLTLASFPLRLVRPEIPGLQPPTPDTVTLGAPLRIAWAAVVLALLASALLAAGIMRLSERRASFVSAVTHELRTPLTTFRLYSDLLEKDAVHGEKRTHYLRVLTREADRLTHLVENVLAFSRIENTRARTHIRATTCVEMLADFRPRLEDRLATAGLTLETTLAPDAAAAPLHTDTAVVEHILFNLIDNAAKYAADSTPPTVHLEAVKSGSHLEIRVRDHGSGIPEAERRRIFKSFHKSARAAAESQPGVGLGLALSLRLARTIGARLEYHPAPQGACFALTLPNRSKR